jgi:hypothetical protein
MGAFPRADRETGCGERRDSDLSVLAPVAVYGKKSTTGIASVNRKSETTKVTKLHEKT